MSSFSHKIYVWFCFASFPCDTSTDFSGKTHITPNELTLSKSGNNSTQQTWGVFRSSGPLCFVVFRHIAHRNGEAISFHWFIFTSATQRLIRYGPKWTTLSFLKRQICIQTRSDDVFQSVTMCSYPHHSPDSKLHGANMGPIWGRQDPGGPHIGPMNFTIWELATKSVETMWRCSSIPSGCNYQKHMYVVLWIKSINLLFPFNVCLFYESRLEKLIFKSFGRIMYSIMRRFLYQVQICNWVGSSLNTLRPRQNGRHFPDNVFKCIFLNENVWI